MSKPKADMRRKSFNDWCHLCGKRSDQCVEIHYPDNAEHDPPVTGPRPNHPMGSVHYIRICGSCGARIAVVAGVLIEKKIK